MKNNMISRNNPFGLIDPFFDEFFTSESNSQFKQMMATDIKEEDDHFELKIDMPDIKKEDIKLSLDEGYLTIEATQNASNDEESHGHFVRRERYFGSYKRSFYVGDNLTEQDIKAKLENGVLTLNVLKKQEV